MSEAVAAERIEMALRAFQSLIPDDRHEAMDRKQIVSRDPDVMNGALVFAGTRVPVEVFVQHLAAGDRLDKFLSDFPSVRREQAVAYLQMTLKEAEAAA